MICNLTKKGEIISKIQHILNIQKNGSGKRKRANKGEKKPKEKITGKRRETEKKQKRRTKKREKLCSTSPPGGNQVDGLPPVPHTGAAYTALNSVSRFFVKFDFFSLLGSIPIFVSKYVAFTINFVYVSLFSLSMSS